MATRKTPAKRAPAKKRGAVAADEVTGSVVATEDDGATGDVADEVSAVEYGRLVVFLLERQKYALPIERVQEIQQIVAYTEIPDETGVILGMVNLRGIVVPLVDLRCLLGLSAVEYHIDTPMIIARTRDSLVALVVDEVEDVAMMPEGCLQKPSRLHALADRLLGVCRMEPDLVFLLDIDRLVPDEAAVPLDPSAWEGS